MFTVITKLEKILSYTLSFKISVLLSDFLHLRLGPLLFAQSFTAAIASISDTHSDPQHSPERDGCTHAFSPPPLLPTRVWAVQSNSFLSGYTSLRSRHRQLCAGSASSEHPLHSSLASVWKAEFLDQLVLHHFTGVSRDGVSVALLKPLTLSSAVHWNSSLTSIHRLNPSQVWGCL